MRRLVLAGLFLLALSFAFLASSPRQSSANHVDPILFVHGYTSDASAWNTMISRFQADGWESNRLFAYTFSSTKSNASIAQDVKARVDQIRAATGAAKVDIITHSMGASPAVTTSRTSAVRPTSTTGSPSAALITAPPGPTAAFSSPPATR